MRENFCTFDYAVIRFVPRVEREEFFNAGIILSCPGHKFLETRIYLDEAKLKCFAPGADAGTIREYLAVIPKICAGEKEAGIIGQLTQRERFYFLTAQRSTIIQSSPVHTGITDEPGKKIDDLFRKIIL